MIIKRFDDYRLEILPPAPSLRDRLRLFHGGDELIVEQRSLEVLEQLLSHPANTLIRDEDIARKIWGGGSIGGGSVDTHICALRKALNDDPHNPRFIETVRGKGYMFLIPWHTEQRSPYSVAETRNGARHAEGDTAQAFDDFFGDGISTHEHDGVVIVQADLIHELFQDAAMRREISHPASRLYKARSWINTWDVLGATVIQDEFQRHGMRAPHLLLRHHYGPDSSQGSAAFRISMGLGFTDETTKTTHKNICGQWMRISKTSGDAVSFHESLLPPGIEDRFQIAEDDKPGFRRLLPKDWDSNYVDSWLAMLPPTNGPEVRDYAMIFRHTHTRPTMHRQVLFVIAGFTERSTAIAARYLAQNWMTLWAQHVQGCAHAGSRGNFLIVVEGPSDFERIEDWSECADLEFTPRKLQGKGVDCDWTRPPRRAPTEVTATRSPD